MKKFLLTAVIALTAITASAQKTNHALGLHIGGSTFDIEYQYHFSEKTFLDATLGAFDLDHGFFGTVIHNWNIKQWGDWTPRFATWKLWGGVGGGIGLYSSDKHNSMMLGPIGSLGFGFTAKKVPFTVGIDYRPMIAFHTGHHTGINAAGFWNLGLTATYRF